MSDLLGQLRSLNFPISVVVKQPIIFHGQTIGWNVYAQNDMGLSLAQGTNIDVSVAERIAIAESFERGLVRRLHKDLQLDSDLGLSELPTSCGFACGFDRLPTEYRAIREGVERWAWSQWIDSAYAIHEVEPSVSDFSDLYKYYSSHFIAVHLFKKKNIVVKLDSGNELVYDFVVAVFETALGVFAGCRAGRSDENLLEHAASEAFRNYSNFNLLKIDPTKTTDSIVAKRNVYFGSNKKAAFDQISKANKEPWPNPNIRILKNIDTGIPGVYLTRCLFENFYPWHLSDEKRFVY